MFPRSVVARFFARAAALFAFLLAGVVALAGCGSSTATSSTATAQPTATATPAAKASVVYVAIGASDAVGVGSTDPNAKAYVPLLISRLPQDHRAYNLGVSGYKVADAVSDELPQAIKDQPTLVTVWIVGNDVLGCTPLDQYQASLDTLLGQLQSKTKAQVFVANAPDMSLLPIFQNGATQTGPCTQGKPAAEIRAVAQSYNTIIAAEVAQHGDTLVDLFDSDLASHPEYASSDGFHPSDQGYVRLADLFWQQITAKHAAPNA